MRTGRSSVRDARSWRSAGAAALGWRRSVTVAISARDSQLRPDRPADARVWVVSSPNLGMLFASVDEPSVGLVEPSRVHPRRGGKRHGPMGDHAGDERAQAHGARSPAPGYTRPAHRPAEPPSTVDRMSQILAHAERSRSILAVFSHDDHSSRRSAVVRMRSCLRTRFLHSVAEPFTSSDTR